MCPLQTKIVTKMCPFKYQFWVLYYSSWFTITVLTWFTFYCHKFSFVAITHFLWVLLAKIWLWWAQKHFNGPGCTDWTSGNKDDDFVTRTAASLVLKFWWGHVSTTKTCDNLLTWYQIVQISCKFSSWLIIKRMGWNFHIPVHGWHTNEMVLLWYNMKHKYCVVALSRGLTY